MRLWPRKWQAPARPPAEDEIDRIAREIEEEDARERAEWEQVQRGKLWKLNAEFRRAAMTGEFVRGEIFLGKDVAALPVESRQEVLDQIAFYTPNMAVEDGVGESEYHGTVFCLRRVWGWAIDRYSDASMEFVSVPALSDGYMICGDVAAESTFPVIRVWKVRDVQF